MQYWFLFICVHMTLFLMGVSYILTQSLQSISKSILSSLFYLLALDPLPHITFSITCTFVPIFGNSVHKDHENVELVHIHVLGIWQL